MVIYLLLSIVLIGLDQLIKWWVVQNLALMSGMDLVKGVVDLFYIQNTGAAWGIFSGKMGFFYIITIVAVAGILYMMKKEKGQSRFAMVAYAMILAGAIGNFIDRVRLGYVVDMFRFTFVDFPIFNFADVCLTVGVVLLFIYILFVEEKEKNH